MILLDSLYINNSGGKILLDYLVKELEKRDKNVFYLFDKRCSNDFSNVPNDRKVYLVASLFNRHSFYLENKDRFSSVLCFGNLGPSIKLSVPVYTYFHQRLFLSIPSNLSFREQLIYRVKTKLFKYLLRKTDYIIVQTQSMKIELCDSIKRDLSDSVLVIPFYEHLIYPDIQKERNSFLYISGGSAHKNHEVLLSAFIKFYDKYKLGKLYLTVDSQFSSLFERIDKLSSKGYPIINLGFVSKHELSEYYAKAEYLVYPSLSESFGLGIIEGIEAGCKVIGADLPYMHAVCTPSILFDPTSVDSLLSCLKLTNAESIKDTNQKVFNEIDKLIDILSN